MPTRRLIKFLVACLACFQSLEATQYAYVCNGSSNTVSVIRLTDNTVVKTITGLGTTPYFATVTRDGSKIYVANNGSSNVSVIDTSTNTVTKTISVGSGPYAIAITPDGSKIYVVNYNGKTVTPIDVASDTAGTPFSVGTSPEGVAFSLDGTKAYVSNTGSNTVTPVTVSSNTPGVAFTVGISPSGICLTPDGTRVYVGSDNSIVTPITVASDTVGSSITVGNSPFVLAITPDGSTAYVCNFNSNTVQPIDLNTQTAGAAFSVGAGTAPRGVAITPDGKKIYVALRTANTVAPITLPNTVGSTIAVGSAPRGVCIPPDQAPTASFSTSIAGSTVFLDASNSSSPDGTIATYAWDFGDGATASVSNPKISHTYGSGGVYRVTLTVTNSNGTSTTKLYNGQMLIRNGGTSAQSWYDCSVVAVPYGIIVTPDGAPAASFSTSVNGLTVSFDGSSSSSPVGTIASYAWDFGDGQKDTKSSPITSHSYSSAGTFTVSLTVTNTAGTSTTVVYTGQQVANYGQAGAQFTQQVTVSALSSPFPYGIAVTPDQAPTASFTASASDPTAFFDGSNSSSPIGSIVSYTWDFGDGTPPLTTTGPTVFHTYSKGRLFTSPLTIANSSKAPTPIYTDQTDAEKIHEFDLKTNSWRVFVVGNGGESVIFKAPSDEVETTPVHWVSGDARIAVTPDGTTAVGASSSTYEVVVLDLTQPDIIPTIVPGFEHPHSVAITPDGTRALVTDTNRGVGIVNLLASPATIEKWVDLYAPFDEAITPDGKTALVATPWDADNLFAVLNIGQEAALAYKIPRSGRSDHDITNITVTPDGTKAFATDTNLSALLVLDLTQSPFVYEYKVSVGGGPQGLAVTPDGKMAVVVNSRDSTLSVLDLLASPISPGYTVPVPAGANEVAITPDGKRA